MYLNLQIYVIAHMFFSRTIKQWVIQTVKLKVEFGLTSLSIQVRDFRLGWYK